MVNTIKVYVKDKAVRSKDFLFNRLLPTKVSIYLKENPEQDPSGAWWKPQYKWTLTASTIDQVNEKCSDQCRRDEKCSLVDVNH